MLWCKVLFINIALLVADVTARTTRIFKGHDTKIENYPYQASIRRDGAHKCGGVIISERHILTAAHCITEAMVYPYRSHHISTGTSTRNDQGNIHEIADVTVHPQYWADDNRSINDVAIITLKDSIVFDKYQQKISLPKHNYHAGDKAIVTGWGFTQQAPIVRPNQLQRLDTEISSQEECQKLVGEEIKIHDTEVCTVVEFGYGTCNGDSGGPLVVDGEIVGIVAWSDGDWCGKESPDVFTNVYKYKDFIESIVN